MKTVKVTQEYLRSNPLSQEMKEADTIEVTDSQGRLVLVMMRVFEPWSEEE